MSKIRTNIYLTIFIVLFLGLITVIVGLIFLKKDKNNNSSLSVTPTPTSELSNSINKISWEEAIKLIQNCQIQSVFQKHDLTVTLTDKKNQIFETTEPNIDDIFDQTNHLRSDCNDTITTITE